MNDQVELPDGSNFFATLETELLKEQVAALFAAKGWRSRKCSWVDFEVRNDWAELVIDGTFPILLHGPVANIDQNAEFILQTLRDAGVRYKAESYGDDPAVILREFAWPHAS
ncbi:hypothetical protein EJO66_32025 [Variovorax beijingensis]|uniref:Uncharacterized protein n=1 Tax=Variovorax beijingensis TaxID=2496117 RepID=A0ABX9ZWI7_9BURK|nr:hypothetical protein [Variovorax beijingensis]RSZ24205.1 hypothetical protein EJO66_32025 [Variovorax beijingensis]